MKEGVGLNESWDEGRTEWHSGVFEMSGKVGWITGNPPLLATRSACFERIGVTCTVGVTFTNGGHVELVLARMFMRHSAMARVLVAIKPPCLAAWRSQQNSRSQETRHPIEQRRAPWKIARMVYPKPALYLNWWEGSGKTKRYDG